MLSLGVISSLVYLHAQTTLMFFSLLHQVEKSTDIKISGFQTLSTSIAERVNTVTWTLFAVIKL